MLTWLLITTITCGGMLTLAAYCVERVPTMRERTTRWIWMSVLFLIVGSLGIALHAIDFRPKLPVSVIQPSRLGRDDFSEQVIVRQTSPIITFAGHRVSILPDVDLVFFFEILSVVAVSVLASIYLQFRRIRRSWPIGTLQGVRVRVAPQGGPVVIGLWHPEIVIPQWLLGRSAEEQRVVLAHEQEHIRAGDHWMLAGACSLVALIPWHPWVWWIASRLRLAIELDCDRRVLRQGITPQTYGSLLLDVAEQGAELPVRMLALTDTGSHLKRRLRAIGPRRIPFAAPVQVLFLGATALVIGLPAALSLLLMSVSLAWRPENNVEGSCGSQASIYENSEYHRHDVAKSPEDSARQFFANPAGGPSWDITSGPANDGGQPLRWSDLTNLPGCSGAHIPHWGERENALARNPMRDSVLVRIDGVRRGVFPVNAPVPFRQLNLNAEVIHHYDISRGGRWATVLYGPEAANGVVDIMSDQKVAQLRAAALRIRDSLGQWDTTIYHRNILDSGVRNRMKIGLPGVQFALQEQPILALRWSDFFTDSMERHRLRDSILVLVNGVRRGMFPVRDSVSLRQLHLTDSEISVFRHTTAPWAARTYGTDATHGVINIATWGDTLPPEHARLRSGQ